MGMERIQLAVFRHRPELGDEPRIQVCEIPFGDNWSVLDALNHIKDEIDGTLSHRWSCRMGVCGACGVNVNGRPVLACTTPLRDLLPGPVRVEPLAHLPIVRDLVVDITDFLRNLQSVRPWIIRQNGDDFSGKHLQTPGQRATSHQLSLCMSCALCHAACPVCAHDPSFLGPAAIAIGHRYNLDPRDRGAERRAGILCSRRGIWGCTFAGDCSRVCPTRVDPAAAIKQAKTASAPGSAEDSPEPAQRPTTH